MDRRQEATIGIGGPLLGSLFSFLLVGLYFLTEIKWLLIIGYVGVFLNLFNMIPISPLDGGRVTQAVGKYFKILGMILLIGVTIALKNPGILLIWILVFFDFNFLPIKIRFALAFLVELAMITFLITRIGIPDRNAFWAVFSDACIGLLYLSMIGIGIFRSKEDAKETENAIDEGSRRPEMTPKGKLQWFLIWLITSVLLYIALLFLEPQLKVIMVS